MDMVNRLKQLRRPAETATKDDVVQAAKAVRDHIKQDMDKDVKGLAMRVADVEVLLDRKAFYVQEHVKKEYEAKIAETSEVLQKAIEGYLEKRLEEMKSSHNKQIEAMEKVYDVYNSKLGNVEMDLAMQLGKVLEDKVDKTLTIELNKTVSDQLNKRLADISGVHAKHLQAMEEFYNKRLSMFEDKYTQDVSFMQKVCEQSLEQIRMLVENLQLPTPQVQVHVPEQPAPKVSVTSPEVVINVPELKTPEVVVNIPQPRLVKKHIAYDDYGRPVEIQEQEG